MTVRFAQESLSVFSRNWCPLSARTAVRFQQEYAPSMANAEHVVTYLGQYPHRVAITNQRILNIADGKVTFIAKDYRDRAIKKPVTLGGVEFLRRFTMHILPKRFVKIRRYGIYNHTVKRKLALQFASKVNSDIDAI